MVDVNEENSSGEDEVVEDVPWFTFPQQKPLFSRARLPQRSAATIRERWKLRVPSNPSLRTSSENEYFASTPSSSISKSGSITYLERNNNETPGVLKAKFSSVCENERQCSAGSARKPVRVLQDILNYHPKKPLENEKSKKENEFPKSYVCAPKGILINTAKKTSVVEGVLPVVAEAREPDKKCLLLKDKPINYEIQNLPPNCESKINGRSARSAICVQCQQQEVFVVKNIEYTVLSRLGRGGSSQVFLVLNIKTSQLLAIKCVELAGVDPASAEGYLKEIELLAQLQSSHRVIKLIDHEYVKSQQTLYVVMERGDTDLSTLLKESAKTGDVSIPMIRYYWTEMLLAVKEIHRYGIVHADLKPANFLLVCGRLKLIDFGIASAMQNDVTSIVKNSMAGTGNYMSPETIQDPGDSSRAKVGYKSDVWSLGCILYSMLYGRTPFQHITNSIAKLQMISNPNHVIDFPPTPGDCPPSLLNAMKKCLQYVAKQRPTISELLKMEF